jgi:hypothetical protein
MVLFVDCALDFMLGGLIMSCNWIGNPYKYSSYNITKVLYFVYKLVLLDV